MKGGRFEAELFVIRSRMKADLSIRQRYFRTSEGSFVYRRWLTGGGVTMLYCCLGSSAVEEKVVSASVA